MKKLFNLSFFYLILALILGIFYREFTKMSNFTGNTVLSLAHTHALVLGFIFFLILILLEKNFAISKSKAFNLWLVFYNLGVLFLIGTIVARGILQIQGSDFAGLSHIAGLGHAILGLSLVWFMINLKNHISRLS